MPPDVGLGWLSEVESLLAEATLLRRQLTASIAGLRRRVTRKRFQRLGVTSAAQLDPAWGTLARRLRAMREHRS